MQRLIVTGPRSAQFEDVPPPACPEEGLLVKARVTSVSTGTELRVFRAIPVDEDGNFLHERVPFALPTENGYSMVGDVLDVGRQVRGFDVGDRVFVPAPHKQVAAVPAELAVRLPDDVSDEEAVFLNILEVAHIALRRGAPACGENVAVVGQGVIGLAAAAYCRAFGLRTVGIDRHADRRELSARMGADRAVPPNPEGCRQLTEFFDDAGADLVLEAASSWSGVRTALEVARPDGKVIVVSRHTTAPSFNPVGHPFLGKRLTLLTSYGYPPDGDRWDRRRSIALTVDLLQRGRLSMRPAITHRCDWQELPSLYERFDRGEEPIVGTVVCW